MNFIYENEAAKTLTFRDVKDNQFFVDNDGYLCQKANHNSFTVIAKPDGTPYSTWIDYTAPNREIQKIIPAVRKIEF